MNILLLILGLYLFLVIYQGNVSEFMKFLMGQKQFLVWAAALVIYFSLGQIQTLKPFIEAFGAIVLTAFAINAASSGAFQSQWSNFVKGNY
jgi:hypothetical protein